MPYFIRTEESAQDAQASLERGRSVHRWGLAGNPLSVLLRQDMQGEEQYAAVRQVCQIFEVDFPEYATPTDLRAALDDLEDTFLDDDEEARAATALGYERMGAGWARFLDGLCALQAFDREPKPEDVSHTLPGGDLFRYLACYEGEQVGWDGDWPLFRPTRLVWVHDRGQDVPAAERVYGA